MVGAIEPVEPPSRPFVERPYRRALLGLGAGVGLVAIAIATWTRPILRDIHPASPHAAVEPPANVAALVLDSEALPAAGEPVTTVPATAAASGATPPPARPPAPRSVLRRTPKPRATAEMRSPVDATPNPSSIQ
jgi:hypothetical protein